MSKLFRIVAVLLCMFFISCDELSNVISFEELAVMSSAADSVAYYERENITLVFSSTMNTQVVERLITLKKDNVAQKTEIIWQNEVCLIKPVGGFCFGEKYSFSLSGQVKTSDGRVYTVDIKREFIFGNKENIFAIEKTVAPIDKNARLEFYFNKELNIASFEQDFNITPYIELKKEYSADKRSVKLFPCDKWQNNIFYTWTIANVSSADGYKIYKTYSEKFMAVDENTRPKIVSLCPVNMAENLDAVKAIFLKNYELSALFGKQPLGIIFSKPMDFDSVKNSIYFEPSISGVLLQADECSFVYAPYEKYKTGKQYLLKIADSVKDIYGMEMAEQRNFYFTTGDEFLKINSANANETPIARDKITEINSTSTGIIFIKIYFSADIDSTKTASIQNAISLNAIFPNTINPAKLNSIHINANCIETEWNNLSRATDNTDCVYELKIAGGKNYLATITGEYLEEDVCFQLRIK